MRTQDIRWMRVRDLFEQAIDMPADQRESFIDRSCPDDPSLREELKALIASDLAHDKGPLTGAIGAAVDATTRDRRQDMVGTVIGPYRLASVLGHGGAGTVYLGERVDRQYSAQVAVKIVEGAAFNAEIGRRFRAERQILANLNHPYIARLIDAGETPQGFPYLVMEYIHGEPIHQYCDKQQLGLEDRIELLLKVCTAVHYAHQNLVVHRDLKPGNILVTPDGTPKLLDFGIAKLLDTGAVAADMALTRLNDRILTPEYASPEQILGQNVTTSSDVYSLGVVLYELLTGLRPYKVSSASQLELERTICVTDPARPSAAVREALSKLNSEPPPTRNIHEIADARSVTPMRLRSLLDGDLDAILLRALRKESIHRYNSVEQFAADLRRHLARAPVLARDGNWLYYSQRFVRRHVFGVAATALFVALITSALVVTSIQAKRIAEQRDAANREKQTSEAVANFMVNVFAAADPFTVQDRQVTATELLDNAAQNIRGDLKQEPAVKASLLEAIAISYRRQGHADRGVQLLEESLQIRSTSESLDSIARARTLMSLGKTQLTLRQANRAKTALDEAKRILQQLHLEKSPEYADVIVDLGRTDYQLGNLKSAQQNLEAGLKLLRAVHGPIHAEVGSALTSLGYVFQWQDQFVEMEGAAREALEIFEQVTPPLHPDRLLAEGLLAESLFNQGQVDEAAPLIERVFANRKKVLGESSSRVAEDLELLIQLRKAQGRAAEAEPLAREAVELKIRRLGNRNYGVAYSRTTLAIILWQLRKYAEAETELRAALDIYREDSPANSSLIASAEYFLAEVLLGRGDANEALQHAQSNLANLHKSGASDWRIARTENSLGQALFQLQRYADAENYLEKSYLVLSKSEGADKYTVQLAQERLTELHQTLDKREK